MKLSKMTWFNTIVSAFCLFCGIYCICYGNVLFGILDIVLAAANLYCVINYIAEWWETSEKIQKKFVFTCKKCEHKFVPSFWRWIFVPHIGSRRYMKCEKCYKISWMRRK